MSVGTVREAIMRGAEQLKAARIDTPQREAARLLELAAGWRAAQRIAREQDALSPESTARFETLLARRLAREPFAHLAEETGFHTLMLKCDRRALIPRADSEAVVDAALECLPAGREVTIADLGTGSGCLLLALLAARPLARGVGVERDPDAFALACENARATGLADRAHMICADWTAWEGWGEADLVIANPPYIPTKEIDGLQPEVRNHDPRAALDGGPDGLDAYREIVSLGAARLKAGARLVLEIGHDQGPAVMSLLQAAGFHALAARRDLNDRDRAVICEAPGELPLSQGKGLARASMQDTSISMACGG